MRSQFIFLLIASLAVGALSAPVAKKPEQSGKVKKTLPPVPNVQADRVEINVPGAQGGHGKNQRINRGPEQGEGDSLPRTFLPPTTSAPNDGVLPANFLPPKKLKRDLGVSRLDCVQKAGEAPIHSYGRHWQRCPYPDQGQRERRATDGEPQEAAEEAGETE
ncbi:MAG: hypothetical protein M1829_004130 [Trizodia sp. TS-e1964]|nr:MAG: hypothetical protein M1829_004130 [Trizodia sp. TS-e1964]